MSEPEHWVMIDGRPALELRLEDCADGTFLDYRRAGERAERWLRLRGLGSPRLSPARACLGCGQTLSNLDCPLSVEATPGVCRLCESRVASAERAVHELAKYGMIVT